VLRGGRSGDEREPAIGKGKQLLDPRKNHRQVMPLTA